MSWIFEIIKKLVAKKHYGRLVISFHNGEITHARIEETIKPC